MLRSRTIDWDMSNGKDPRNRKCQRGGKAYQQPVCGPILAHAPCSKACMSRQTVKNGEKVPETQPTTFSLFVRHEYPGAHVNGWAVTSQ